METKVALPTIGRVVYVYTNGIAGVPKDKPFAAIVADVDGLTINAMVIGHSGDIVLGGAQNIAHVSEHSAQTFWWDWMPFQKGQAKKTEELEDHIKQMAQAVGKAADQGVDALHRTPRSYDHVPRIEETAVKLRGRGDGDQGSDLGKLQSSTPSPVDGKR